MQILLLVLGIVFIVAMILMPKKSSGKGRSDLQKPLRRNKS